MQLYDQLRARTPCLDPGTRPELHLPSPAAQTRIVSVARIRLDSRKSVRPFKGIICADISEFESSHPRHAVRSAPSFPGALSRSGFPVPTFDGMFPNRSRSSGLRY